MDKEELKKQMFINISELLAQQGLLTEDEKNQLKILLSSQGDIRYEKSCDI